MKLKLLKCLYLLRFKVLNLLKLFELVDLLNFTWLDDTIMQNEARYA